MNEIKYFIFSVFSSKILFLFYLFFSIHLEEALSKENKQENMLPCDFFTAL